MAWQRFLPTWQSCRYLCEQYVWLLLRYNCVCRLDALFKYWWLLIWLSFFYSFDTLMQIEMRGVPIVAHWSCLCEGKLSHTWTNEKSIWWAVCITHMGSKPVWLHPWRRAKADDFANTSNESCRILGALLSLLPLCMFLMMSVDGLTTLISAACSILFMASFAVIFLCVKPFLLCPLSKLCWKGCSSIWGSLN